MDEYGGIVETSRIGTEQLSIEWRISDFSSMICNKIYLSPDFVFDGERWFMGLNPNNMKQKWLSLDLYKHEGGLPKTIRFSVGIRGSGGVEKRREWEREFSDDDRYYAWDDFCSRSDLVQNRTRLMPDGILVITCVLKRPDTDREVYILQRSDENVTKSGGDSEVTLKEQDEPVHKDEVNVLTEESQFSEIEAMKELQTSMRSLLKSEDDCDVVLHVRGKEFRAHRSILRARSPVFQAMFTHDMVEKQRGVVTMEDCDPETFPDFLEHIYTGSIQMISANNVFSLYAASDKYDLKALKKECTQFMKKYLSVASFCKAIALAVKYEEKELIERATEFFCNNTLDIVKTAEWQIFLKENSTVGNELFIKFIIK